MPGIVDPNYVFVIMSFNDDVSETYKAFRNAGDLVSGSINIVIERVSENRGNYIITDKIENCIRKAGLVLCDVLIRSPNVYYELGYARALGKEVIPTAKHGTELPFGTHNLRTIFYKKSLELQDEITKELKTHYRIS